MYLPPLPPPDPFWGFWTPGKENGLLGDLNFDPPTKPCGPGLEIGTLGFPFTENPICTVFTGTSKAKDGTLEIYEVGRNDLETVFGK
jgi:hypothetical protein